tara:strand:- start:2904 stop:3719 length:816 start_codon:yes stop_codon:yes gene_type:complete
MSNTIPFKQYPKSCSIKIDQNTTIGENVVISEKCKSISIGFGSFIGRDIYIDSEILSIGDYSTVHHGAVIQGKEVSIGHNCWFGHYTIIDGTGGCVIGNNVGVGSHSQLWSHMKFGDKLEGCRFNTQKKLILEDDVWLVGRTTLGPITAKNKSMLLANSYATKDLDSNCLYSGNPAVKLENSKGQFKEKNAQRKCAQLREIIDTFLSLNDFKEFKYNVITEGEFSKEDYLNGVTQFNTKERTYCPVRSREEYLIIKYLLYDKAKFLPRDLS